jgi:hypothetical protein
VVSISGRSEELRLFYNFKPRLENDIAKFISWLNGSFLRVTIEVF